MKTRKDETERHAEPAVDESHPIDFHHADYMEDNGNLQETPFEKSFLIDTSPIP